MKYNTLIIDEVWIHILIDAAVANNSNSLLIVIFERSLFSNNIDCRKNWNQKYIYYITIIQASIEFKDSLRNALLPSKLWGLQTSRVHQECREKSLMRVGSRTNNWSRTTDLVHSEIIPLRHKQRNAAQGVCYNIRQSKAKIIMKIKQKSRQKYQDWK